jgi:hypothetical protein
MSNNLKLIHLLLAVIREWKCPACGGKGSYLQRGFAGEQFHSHHVQCKKCEGSGYHPIAREAIQTAINPPYNIKI